MRQTNFEDDSHSGGALTSPEGHFLDSRGGMNLSLPLLFETMAAKGFASDEELKRYYRVMMMRLLNIEPYEYKKINMILDCSRLSDILLSSDLHFLRDPENVEMQKIRAHNSTITNNSVWICLGDIGYKYNNDPERLYEYIKQLNKGKYSILVLGNHDMYGREFYYNCGFNFICKAIMWKDIIFTHIPFLDVMKGDYRINIHGHTHSMTFEVYTNKHGNPEMTARKNFYIKVWTDKHNGYRPISLYQLLTQYSASLENPLEL